MMALVTMINILIWKIKIEKFLTIMNVKIPNGLELHQLNLRGMRLFGGKTFLASKRRDGECDVTTWVEMRGLLQKEVCATVLQPRVVDFFATRQCECG